jgi:aminoglycoside phosphotransferase family enzyme/predicted kinase
MHRQAQNFTLANSSLIESLLRPDAYPHPVDKVELIETHISWVLLTGDYVYKIKKPLDLGFLDFHSLERRRFYCEEEIRLNKPWAPDIYIDVVPITFSKGVAQISGSGAPAEYAVRMHSFDQAMRLDQQLESGNLSVADMHELATTLARRHGSSAIVAHAKRTHTVRRAIEQIEENFDPLEGAIERALLGEMRAWTTQQLHRLDMFLWERFDDGFFRECHGDLHMGNLVRLPGGIATFDCIEFNEDLRNTDVMADIAFLIMDLVVRQKTGLAAHCLNRYLELTGDYSGMRVFNLYFTYRCLVRAKVAVIRSTERDSAGERQDDLEEAHRYCELARHQIRQRVPVLMIMTGLSGSGKTWISGELMAALPAIRIRSDIERKRSFNLAETASSESGLATGIYSSEASEDVYGRLNAVAEILLAAGHCVILDASFPHVKQRAAALDTGKRAGSHCLLLHAVADEAVLRKRIVARQKKHDDASEADIDVLEFQLRDHEPLTEKEQQQTIQCKSDGFDAARIAEYIRSVAGGTK